MATVKHAQTEAPKAAPSADQPPKINKKEAIADKIKSALLPQAFPDMVDEGEESADNPPSEEPAKKTDSQSDTADEFEDDDQGESPEVESDEEEHEETPLNMDKMVEVNVNGETLEVPLKEALAGYSRQQDYTQKSQKLAENLKYFENAANAFFLKDDIISTVKELGQQGMQQLLREDPQTHYKLEQEYKSRMAMYQEAAKEISDAKEAFLNEEKQELRKKQHANAEAFKAARPELKDPEKLGKFLNSMRSFLNDAGVPAEAQDYLGSEPYELEILYKAMRYDQMLKKKSQLDNEMKVNKKKPVRISGGSSKLETHDKQSKERSVKKAFNQGKMNKKEAIASLFKMQMADN